MSERTERGFAIVKFRDAYGVECSIQQSSAIDFDTEDGLERPGTSYLWLGCDDAAPQYFVPNGNPPWRPVEMPEEYVANTRMHLNRDQVKMLIASLNAWLDTGEFDSAEWPNAIE